jgi:hypothetical protein
MFNDGYANTRITASTGVELAVLYRPDLFYLEHADRAGDVEVCLGVDLFEVIAELAGLELELEAQIAEALGLAAIVHRRFGLRAPAEGGECGQDDGDDQCRADTPGVPA